MSFCTFHNIFCMPSPNHTLNCNRRSTFQQKRSSLDASYECLYFPCKHAISPIIFCKSIFLWLFGILYKFFPDFDGITFVPPITLLAIFSFGGLWSSTIQRLNTPPITTWFHICFSHSLALRRLYPSICNKKFFTHFCATSSQKHLHFSSRSQSCRLIVPSQSKVSWYWK